MRQARASSRVRPAAVLSIVAVLLLGVVYAVFTGTAAGRSIDAAIVRRDLFVSREAPAELVSAPLSSAPTLLAVLVVVWLAVARRRWSDGLRGAVVVVCSGAGARALKSLLSNLDPLGDETRRAIGAGFYPSGHAAVAMGLAFAVLLVAQTPSRRLMLAGGIWCSLQGFVIVADRQHHLSDVLGGFLLAAAVAGLVLSLSGWRPRVSGRLEALPVVAIAKVLALGIVAAAVFEALHLTGLPVGGRLRVVLIAGVVQSATAFALIGACARALDAPAAT